LKKPRILRCERTAKISDLFQSCKYFFKNLAFFFKPASASDPKLLYCKLPTFVRTRVFLKRGCKGRDFFRTCKYFGIFFSKKVKKVRKTVPKGHYTYIYLEVRQIADTERADGNPIRRSGRSLPKSRHSAKSGIQVSARFPFQHLPLLSAGVASRDETAQPPPSAAGSRNRLFAAQRTSRMHRPADWCGRQAAA